MTAIRDAAIKKLNDEGYTITIAFGPNSRPRCTLSRYTAKGFESFGSDGSTDEEAVLLAAQRLARKTEL